MANAANEDLHEPFKCPTILHCDNQCAICLAENLVFHARTKHVEAHDQFIREKVQQGDWDARLKNKSQIYSPNQHINKEFKRRLNMISRLLFRESSRWGGVLINHWLTL